MKKTPLKRKTALSARPKSEKARLKAEVWNLVSAYVRLRDALMTTGSLDECRCVTCGRRKPLFVRGGIEAGHFIPGRHNSILYDVRAIHGQCSYCNDYLKGNWVPYRDYMVRMYGVDMVEDLIRRDREIVSYKDYELEVLADEMLVSIENVLKSAPAIPDPVRKKLYKYRDRLPSLLKKS